MLIQLVNHGVRRQTLADRGAYTFISNPFTLIFFLFLIASWRYFNMIVDLNYIILSIN